MHDPTPLRWIDDRPAVSCRSQLVRTTIHIANAGCIGGLVLALIVAQSLSAMLYGVSPSDPANLAAVIAVVMIVAALAALVPAVRAASVQPMGALREE